MAESGFKSKDMGIRAQKKILSRMANKTIAKAFIDESTGQLLDNLHSITEFMSGNKKDADKVIKNIIKIVIKIGILSRNDQFTQDELVLAERFKRKFHSMAMTIISFYEVDFSYDRNFLMKSLNECCAMLKELVGHHLTDGSLARIDHVFTFFSNPANLDMAFKYDGDSRGLLGKIVDDMHRLMEEGGL